MSKGVLVSVALRGFQPTGVPTAAEEFGVTAKSASIEVWPEGERNSHTVTVDGDGIITITRGGSIATGYTGRINDVYDLVRLAMAEREGQFQEDRG